MQPVPPEQTINQKLVQLAVLRDAAHFADTQPLETIDTTVLTSACSLTYIACGLDEGSAMTLVAESITRHTDRLLGAIAEVFGE